ncbi:MAG: hypothetical protein ACW963_09930 [Candidatus Sifarchaeia archaeon]|jgi:hypothetical protein
MTDELIEREREVVERIQAATGYTPNLIRLLLKELRPDDVVRAGLRVIPDAGIWVTPSEAIEECREAAKVVARQAAEEMRARCLAIIKEADLSLQGSYPGAEETNREGLMDAIQALEVN